MTIMEVQETNIDPAHLELARLEQERFYEPAKVRVAVQALVAVSQITDGWAADVEMVRSESCRVIADYLKDA